MAKLRNCAVRWGQSTPNVCAICPIGPPPVSCCSIKASTLIVAPSSLADATAPARARIQSLLHEEQGVEHDGFREGDGQDRLHENRRGRAWISSNRLRCLHSDETYGQGGAQDRKSDVKVAGQH